MNVSLNHLVLSGSPAPSALPGGRKPSWLKMKMPGGEGYAKLLKLVNEQRLHTVCQSAKCPNMGECWSAGTAGRRRWTSTSPGGSARPSPP
jgi:lipoate synthase